MLKLSTLCPMMISLRSLVCLRTSKDLHRGSLVLRYNILCVIVTRMVHESMDIHQRCVFAHSLSHKGNCQGEFPHTILPFDFLTWTKLMIICPITVQVIGQLKVLMRSEAIAHKFDKEKWSVELSPILNLWKKLNQVQKHVTLLTTFLTRTQYYLLIFIFVIIRDHSYYRPRFLLLQRLDPNPQ